MARSVSQTLIQSSHHFSLFATRTPPASRLLVQRKQSSQSEKSQLVDSNPVDTDTERREALAVQRIEDAIHRIIVRRSAPDWLPFQPGASYWVPPRRRSLGIAELVHKLANTLTEEEALSLTTVRGWPSSAFYVNGARPHSAEEETMGMNQSEDEEG